MTLTTTVVNAHALSHLFDGESPSIEQCQTCDEYVVSNHDKVSFTSPVIEDFTFSSFEFKTQSNPTLPLEFHILVNKPEKYFNKPPPSFKLV